MSMTAIAITLPLLVMAIVFTAQIAKAFGWLRTRSLLQWAAAPIVVLFVYLNYPVIADLLGPLEYSRFFALWVGAFITFVIFPFVVAILISVFIEMAARRGREGSAEPIS